MMAALSLPTLQYLLRLVGFAFFLSITATGLAAEESILTFGLLPAQPLGQQVKVILRLSNGAAQAIPDTSVLLYLNDGLLQRVYTNSLGIATVVLNDLPAGQHRLVARFVGNRAYRSAKAGVSLTVEPAILEVKAVPGIAGLQFMLDGRTFRTGTDGVARITIERSGTYRLEHLPWDDDALGIRISFSRWQDQTFTPYREVSIPAVKRLEAGFNLSYLVDFAFVERRGIPVPAERLTSMMFKSSHGQTHVVNGQEAVWLQANRILRRTWGLEAREIRYVLENVVIDESNVVNRGQQRFLAKPHGTWVIETLLYYARFQAIDAVFGFPLGDGITLEYPDGRIEAFSFGSEGVVEVGPLARGLYKAQVTGASGMAPPTPVALSRDQSVELKVLSKLDMGVGLMLGMVLALSLLFYGRPQLFGLILRLVFWPVIWPIGRLRRSQANPKTAAAVQPEAKATRVAKRSDSSAIEGAES